MHGQAGDLAAEEPGCALIGFGQAKPLAGGPDGGCVANFRLDLNKVTHNVSQNVS